MMTLQDFHYLSFDKKCDLITFCANYIMHKELGKSKVFLYAMDKFFIEVYFTPEEDRLLHIYAFSDTKNLTDYIEKISLEELFV